MELRHRAIAMIALEVAGPFGFALAGGYAVRAHGMGDRPSADVDLFRHWQRRADFPAAVDVVVALERHDYTVQVRLGGHVRISQIAEGGCESGCESGEVFGAHE